MSSTPTANGNNQWQAQPVIQPVQPVNHQQQPAVPPQLPVISHVNVPVRPIIEPVPERKQQTEVNKNQTTKPAARQFQHSPQSPLTVTKPILTTSSTTPTASSNTNVSRFDQEFGTGTELLTVHVSPKQHSIVELNSDLQLTSSSSSIVSTIAQSDSSATTSNLLSAVTSSTNNHQSGTSPSTAILVELETDVHQNELWWSSVAEDAAAQDSTKQKQQQQQQRQDKGEKKSEQPASAFS